MALERLVFPTLLRYVGAFPCVALLGPRQVGKTTLAKILQTKIAKESIYLDLESDEDLEKLTNAEQYFNQRADKLLIIDEIQRNPALFRVLRSVIDRNRENGRFVILGSAAPELLAQSAETLAGRIAYLELHPLVFQEITPTYPFDDLWLKGGFPTGFLQTDSELSFEIRVQFIQTYLERELPILGLSVSPVVLKNLIRMVAHSQGQIVSYTELSNSIGVEVNTIKRYLDYFENAFLIRRLPPYFANSKKRLVKSPKIFIRDTGILHTLFNLETQEDLEGFNGKGNSWESFVIQQVMAQLRPNVSSYFYRTQDGSELDLVLVRGVEPVLGLEIKYSNAPKISKGTTIASQDLGNLPILVVTHSASEDYDHNATVKITSFERLFTHLTAYRLI
ncbi:ATP-binding protein [Runella slithyformis]|uniref:AAA ATPase n=1 Tax=Runella slithyformis (strain ATCC 29530 / DSM 19594 / LMG 11500 / NCIMB 11436 / LSU 4) TaxID=761193 RepID=A0A7U4E7L2_RUNSL|nr:ATP-binding protein [Runella slithyformis]AEI50786.1 AAA ATPase [Runella slithyformis DSM 19594]